MRPITERMIDAALDAVVLRGGVTPQDPLLRTQMRQAIEAATGPIPERRKSERRKGLSDAIEARKKALQDQIDTARLAHDKAIQNGFQEAALGPLKDDRPGPTASPDRYWTDGVDPERRVEQGPLAKSLWKSGYGRRASDRNASEGTVRVDTLNWQEQAPSGAHSSQGTHGASPKAPQDAGRADAPTAIPEASKEMIAAAFRVESDWFNGVIKGPLSTRFAAIFKAMYSKYLEERAEDQAYNG